MSELGYDQCEKARLVKIRIDGKDMRDGKDNKCKGLKRYERLKVVDEGQETNVVGPMRAGKRIKNDER